MAKKTKKQLVKERVLQELQSRYHVTGRELASGSFIYGDATITVEEVQGEFEREYGVSLAEKVFQNWDEFAESIGKKVSQKRKNLM